MSPANIWQGPIHAPSDGRRHTNRESPPSYSTEPHRNRNDGHRPPHHHHSIRPLRTARVLSPSISDTAGIRRYHERISPLVISAYKGIQASTTRLKMELETLTNNVDQIAPGDDTIEWSRTPTLIFYIPVPLSWSGRTGRSLSNPEIYLPGHLAAFGTRVNNVTEPDATRVTDQNTNITSRGFMNQPQYNTVASARGNDVNARPAQNLFNQYREPDTNIQRSPSAAPSRQSFDPVHAQHRRLSIGGPSSRNQAQAHAQTQQQTQAFQHHIPQQQQQQQQQNQQPSLDVYTAQSNTLKSFYPQQADIHRIMEENMRLGHRTQGGWRETNDDLDM